MELNYIVKGLELIGTTVKELKIENSIIDIERDAKRSFGLEINEPVFEEIDDEIYAQMTIDFDVEISQLEDEECRIHLSMEGAFCSDKEVELDTFKELVIINGAAALVGIARGKIEALSATIFNNGKVVIPFVNVIDYYKEMVEND